ncbi:FkbM family methyltransferase [Bradyrhizobium yuanmingense]|uniref:FkbM family methyltransferase n=1 Tax=Bradyrhizobium yuanmingense TaxID=108015 RepID=UPI0023B8DA42|nr:FkbM family methyltransferase [Bradyrhizobium yuanmingense]MDF0494646.1 FkbM family methyltransferase [Bradyrhizobium yuanmingense]
MAARNLPLGQGPIVMNLKPLARFAYANIPGVAAARFAFKDAAASYLTKPEYRGAARTSSVNGLIIDIGANRGQSIQAFKKFRPQSRIAAFEPEPISADRLKLRFSGDRSVSIFSCALGAEPGTITFFVPSYGRWACDGMAATSREAATDWLRDGGRMYRFDQSKLTVEEHRIECRTLDSFAMSPSLIKVHAQGAELDILRGSEHTLRRHKPALMCAFASDEISDFVSDIGYQPYVFQDGRFISGLAPRSVTFTWYLTDGNSRGVQIDAGSPDTAVLS